MNNKAIICPALRYLRAIDQLPADEHGRVKASAVFRSMQDNLKLTGPMAGLLTTMSFVSNHPLQTLKNIRLGSFMPGRMRAGILHHPTDTGILGSGTFDEDRWAMLAAMSSDGVALSLEDVSGLVAVDYARDGSRIGAMMSIIELGSIVVVFGEQAEDGGAQIKLATLRALYEGRIPEGWCPVHAYGIRSLTRVIGRISRKLPTAPGMLWA